MADRATRARLWTVDTGLGQHRADLPAILASSPEGVDEDRARSGRRE